MAHHKEERLLHHADATPSKLRIVDGGKDVSVQGLRSVAIEDLEHLDQVGTLPRYMKASGSGRHSTEAHAYARVVSHADEQVVTDGTALRARELRVREWWRASEARPSPPDSVCEVT